MSKYISYFGVSFRAFLVYKVDVIISMVAEMAYFYVYLALWITVYSASGASHINDYTLSAMVTYYFVVSLIFRIEPSDWIYLGIEIWNGNFTNDLVKPWNVRFLHYLVTASQTIGRLLIFIPIGLFMYFSAAKFIIFPGHENLIYFAVSLVFAFFLEMTFLMIFHALAFYFGDQEANLGLIFYIIMFLGGATVPLRLLPSGIKTIVEILPFKYIFDIPANIFLGKIEPGEIYLGWVKVLFWILGFYVIFYFVYKGGLKRYTGVGR